jgi:hypothetical protein
MSTSESETLLPNLEASEELSPLDRKRPRIYTTLLLFQVLSLISNVIIVPASKDANTMISFHAANLVNVFFALLLTAATLNFLFYFIKKKVFFWIAAFLFFVSIGLSFVCAILKLNEHDFELYRMVYGTASLISIVMLCFTFFIAIRDIFGEKLKVGSALLGAANVYLLIASGFAFTYAFLSILMPGSMVPVTEYEELFNHCVIGSTYCLAGMDLPWETQVPAVHNVMMFESIFTHLYSVFIVGRLLAK